MSKMEHKDVLFAEDQLDYLKEASKELFGKTNVNAYIRYLVKQDMDKNK